jgi:hypothetical protein
MFRICIPTAGLGSRLGEATRNLNKALISVSNRPAISHIIEQLPEETEIVVPVGFKGNLVREYLELAHPDNQFIFAQISPFSGPGSGLGTTLLQVQHLLREPFLFSACDALTDGVLPPPDHNWIGYGVSSDKSRYRTIRIENNQVIEILEKGELNSGQSYPYCGICGISNYEHFWDVMKNGEEDVVSQGESFGLKSLISHGLTPYEFNWFDIGTSSDLEKTRIALAHKGPNPNVLQKIDEAIWFVGEKVVKYSDDEGFIRKRVLRAENLSGFIPPIVSSTAHMFSYPLAQGQVLSSVIDTELFLKLLTFADRFWHSSNTKTIQLEEFKDVCLRFYKDKTFERIASFREIPQFKDIGQPINGTKSYSIDQLLEIVDWDWLAEGKQVRFHGDFHFENILYNDQDDNFVLLDWRQDFGGLITVGDQYYDLAKLLHGLIVSHKAIVNNRFNIHWTDREIEFSLPREKVLEDCESIFMDWMNNGNIDVHKVYILTALIFLNIAPLHHYPYNQLLYALGKLMLQKEMKL